MQLKTNRQIREEIEREFEMKKTMKPREWKMSNKSLVVRLNNKAILKAMGLI